MRKMEYWYPFIPLYLIPYTFPLWYLRRIQHQWVYYAFFDAPLFFLFLIGYNNVNPTDLFNIFIYCLSTIKKDFYYSIIPLILSFIHSLIISFFHYNCSSASSLHPHTPTLIHHHITTSSHPHINTSTFIVFFPHPH